MKLHVVGYDTAPESLVNASEFRDCPWAEKGCFKQQYKWDIDEARGVLTVRFTCKRLIDRNLSGKELLAVKQHEQHHFDDFKGIVVKLKQSIQTSIHMKSPLDMDNRMEWFDWDVNEASNQFHRGIGMMPNVMMQPMNSRPNP